MSNELIINASLPETRIALLEDGEIQELLIERASGKGIVGNIYKGRVTRVLPGMQAAFVDIGLEKAAFLYVDDVFVHSEVYEDEEGNDDTGQGDSTGYSEPIAAEPAAAVAGEPTATPETPPEMIVEDMEPLSGDDEVPGDPSEEFEDDEEDDEPMEMGPGGDDGQPPEGTIAPPAAPPAEGGGDAEGDVRRRRRGRRGGRNRRRREGEPRESAGPRGPEGQALDAPENFHQVVEESGEVASDREGFNSAAGSDVGAGDRPAIQVAEGVAAPRVGSPQGRRPEFRENRGRDRKIKPKDKAKSVRGQANIQDLLKEGQEVLVQVAKDPISTKGARLTCHISLPGRHLVCMPTIDHVGVSRRIERDDERRKLRESVERYRPKNLGFIVRTASGKNEQSDKRIKQDIDYLTRLWDEIREKAAQVNAPALVYEDLNSVLRAIRDWVTEDIDKIVVDSRFYFNDIQRFVGHFMPALRQRVELYNNDVPIFDAYNISTELARSLERKVWLKSGGYLVIDQAEALVAIDVNTGRFVGKKSLEDTILKTNLEAVQEIAYQLRLRNCGGIIILDLIDMEKEENKQRVYRALEEAIKKDRARPSILKISELGLVEMTRKRTRDTMVRAMCESCSHCEGKSFIKSKQTVAYEIMRDIEREGADRDVTKFLVQAHADVIDVLAIEERDTLDQLERRYNKQIYLQAVLDNHPEQFTIVSEKREGAERSRERDRDRDRGRDRGERGDRDRGSRDRGGRDRGGRDRGGQERQQAPRIPAPLPAGSQPQPVPTHTQAEVDAMSEEDRLAYLRAQAAQDAALAGGNGMAQGSGNRDRGERGERGGRGRRRRGRRGGKGRPQPGPAGEPAQAGPAPVPAPAPTPTSSDPDRSTPPTV